MKAIIWKQIDRTGENIHVSYLLDRVSGRRGEVRKGLESAGWEWVRGPEGGCYVTDDEDLANRTAEAFRCLIKSNGT